MEGTQMESVIIIQLTPNISHVITAFLHSLHKTCNLEQIWTAHVFMEILGLATQNMYFLSEKIARSGVPLLSQGE